VPRVLLDTTAYIDLERLPRHLNKPWAVNTLRQANSYAKKYGKACLSALTVMELARGYRQELIGGKRDTFEQEIASAFDIVDFNVSTACLAGSIYADLERSRQRIGITDTGLAATAIHHGLLLVSANTDHFRRVIELGYPLALANWRNDLPDAH